VAIVDFDVHHGNGTQHLFEERDDVFFASTHQYPFYPGSGAATETGRGAGLGFTLNLPLPAGAGDGELERAVGEQIVTALRRFAPEIVLLSAGFDAWQDDPIGGLEITADGFAAISRTLAATAHELCHGRLLSVLEGGYDLAALPLLVETHLVGLSSVPH
jgi:acetoin utilization deacetylase AcuC-like enzyme